MNTHAYRLSRRTAFGLAGAASATVALAACSGGVNGVSSQSERTDFSGEIKFDNFDTSAGEYKPATKDHPAENVPKPKKPDNANDKSAAGFYSSIGYLFASMQYFFESFDPEPMMEVIADNTGQKVPASQFEQLKQMGAGGIVWFYDIKITGSLKTPQPKMDGDTYTWDGSVTMKAGGMGGRGGMSRELNQEQSQDVTFKGVYKDGKWMITNPNQDSTSSSSASPSSSSSSGSLFGI